LAGKNGSIDWCCLPRFDSPSVFAAILDSEKGGFFRIAPIGDFTVKQMYLPDTNILVTRFHGEHGMAEVVDFMPVGRDSGGQADQSVTEEPLDGQQLLTETARFWRGWVAHSKYHGRWREVVTRSALVLKLMTYLPTGAIVAAPTTSLPESIGGVRNWDYRYTWVRDAAFTVYSLMRLGYTEE